LKIEKISIQDARHLATYNQLLTADNKYKIRQDVLSIIEKLGYIQIDTISIIERAHKHVLWTRFPDFKNEMLDDLIDKEKKIFEFWDHAAAYLPMKYFRFSLNRKIRYAKKYREWAIKNKKIIKYVRDKIHSEGPKQSRDFEHPAKRSIWWDWKPTKDALEYLFHTGELMVKARKGFQKVYDLTERILPVNIDTRIPTAEELSEHLILKSINAGGIVSTSEMTYLRHHDPKATSSVINMMTEKKEITPVKIHMGAKEEYFTTPNILKQLSCSRQAEKQIHILSPFDNLVIQRKRLKNLFGFDYVIECYLPSHKRKFGYFCLPLLHGNEFIGRLDAKADRKTGMFRIINIFWESSMNKKKRLFLYSLIEKKLLQLAKFSGCSEIYISENTY
jgi:uncharacterized protein YcaQ